MSKEKTLRAKLAFTKSMKRLILAAAAAGVIGVATAETASANGFVYGGGVSIQIGNCFPPGTYLGYLGKHCWSNYRDLRPGISIYGYPTICQHRVIIY